VTSEQFLGLCAVIIAAGGAVAVIRAYVLAPIITFVRLIQKMAANVADLLDRMGEVEPKVDAITQDIAEIKGALRATGILPDHED
jgi:hypothetical protein